MQQPVQVEIVRAKPDLQFLVPVYGLTTTKAAREWGQKMGMAVVYFIETKQRAYGLKAKAKSEAKNG